MQRLIYRGIGHLCAEVDIYRGIGDLCHGTTSPRRWGGKGILEQARCAWENIWMRSRVTSPAHHGSPRCALQRQVRPKRVFLQGETFPAAKPRAHGPRNPRPSRSPWLWFHPSPGAPCRRWSHTLSPRWLPRTSSDPTKIHTHNQNQDRINATQMTN